MFDVKFATTICSIPFQSATLPLSPPDSSVVVILVIAVGTPAGTAAGQHSSNTVGCAARPVTSFKVWWFCMLVNTFGVFMSKV